jgi:hypothetical protein
LFELGVDPPHSKHSPNRRCRSFATGKRKKAEAAQCVFWVKPDHAITSKLLVHALRRDDRASQSVSSFGISMSHWHSTALEEAAQKWRALAERRRADFVEFYRSGRWKRYYTEEQFLHRMREAIRASERWAKIAPLPARTGLAGETRSSANL